VEFKIYLKGWRKRFTAPTIAASHSPRLRLSHARCTAMSEDEQALSTGMLGPLRSSAKETLFAIDQDNERPTTCASPVFSAPMI